MSVPDFHQHPGAKIRARCGQALCLDRDSRREGVTARRNVLFGLWAARRLGIAPAEQEAYAWAVHFSDFEEPGDEDLLDKVRSDFAERGLRVPDHVLRHQLREMELKAHLQLLSPETASARRGRTVGQRS